MNEYMTPAEPITRDTNKTKGLQAQNPFSPVGMESKATLTSAVPQVSQAPTPQVSQAAPQQMQEIKSQPMYQQTISAQPSISDEIDRKLQDMAKTTNSQLDVAKGFLPDVTNPFQTPVTQQVAGLDIQAGSNEYQKQQEDKEEQVFQNKLKLKRLDKGAVKRIVDGAPKEAGPGIIQKLIDEGFTIDGLNNNQFAEKEAGREDLIKSEQGLGERLYNLPSEIGKSLSESGERYKNKADAIVEAQREGKQTYAETAGQGIGLSLGLVGEGAFDVAVDTIDAILPNFVKKGAKSTATSIIQTDLGKAGLQKLSEGVESWNGRAKENPRTARNLEGVFEIGAAFAPAIKGTKAFKSASEGVKTGIQGATKGIKQGATKLGKEIVKQAPTLSKYVGEGADVIGKGLKSVKKGGSDALESGIKKIKNIGVFDKAAKRQKGIIDVISEAPTSANLKKAVTKGTLVTEKKGLLFGKDAGYIKASPQLERAAGIIEKNLKNIPKEPEKLYQEIKKQGLKMADELAPELKKVSLESKLQNKVLDIATEIEESVLKNQRVSEMLTSREKKLFKNLVDDMLGSKNIDDIRKSRITLDKLMSQSVKTAGSTSDAITQLRQQQWLDIRGSINDLMEGAMKNQGGVKNKFKDMSSLFEAGENIVSKSKDIAKGEKGLLSKSNILKGAIGAAGLGGTTALFN